MATIAPIVDPMTEEQNARYWQSFMRGRTGARLAQEAGVPVPRGVSPPIIPPVLSAEQARVDALPNQWTNRAVAAPGTEEISINPEALNQLPVAQAQSAINAAMQYQAQRGYMRDIENGTSPDQALAKWGPMMFRSGAGMSSLMKNIAARNEAPDSGEWMSKEVFPDSGIFAVRAPNAKTTTIVNKPRDELKKNELVKAYSDYIALQKDVANMDTGSPEYTNAVTYLEKLGRLISGQTGTNAVVPPPAVVTNAPAVTPTSAPFRFTPRGSPGLGISTTPTKLTREQAEAFLNEVGRDPEKARELARKSGYTF